jgi:enoyl-CoA hydratase/carnithine racemase
VLLRGRGESFCTGGDVAMLSNGHSWQEVAAFAGETFDRIAASRRVSIAVVHGHAVAGGFELLLACDLAIAASDARIGDLHIRHGLYPGAGSAHRLPRLVGLRKAKELLLSGDLLSGSEAQEWGIVNAVAPAEALDELASRFAARFADKSPTASWLTKSAANRALDADARTLAALDQLASGVISHSADANEGVRAFREKRPPAWRPLGPSLEANFDLNDDDGDSG